MAPQFNNPELTVLLQALGDLRDSWMYVSMALKDQLTESPSALRDEVMVEVERHLARIREGERGSSE
jgi:hypothetical protein